MIVPIGSRVCAECVHYSAHECVRSFRKIGIDPVTGRGDYAGIRNAYAERSGGPLAFARCGPKAKFFEAKKR